MENYSIAGRSVVSETVPDFSAPCVSFTLFAYNQEKFVAEAVEGALAQDCHPLQIILSDDHSTDSTYKIMCDVAASYRGPHEVVLHQCERNLGLIGHINKVMSMASGQLIVTAAGDDISVPSRCRQMLELWERGDRKSGSLYSSVAVIDAAGKFIKQAWSAPPSTSGLALLEAYLAREFTVMGASQCWTREVFERFGPLPDKLLAEDRAIAVRGILLGGVSYTDQPLVKYRRHELNLSGLRRGKNWGRVRIDQEWRKAENLRVLCEHLLSHDVEETGVVPPEYLPILHKWLERSSFEAELFQSNLLEIAAHFPRLFQRPEELFSRAAAILWTIKNRYLVRRSADSIPDKLLD